MASIGKEEKKEGPFLSLTQEEEDLILAWRRSDLRGKKSVRTALEPFWRKRWRVRPDGITEFF